MQVFKRIIGAFFVGGVIAILSQLLMDLFMMFIPQMGLAVQVTLIATSIIASILAVFGIYQKVEKVGLLGAWLPFAGLGSMIVSIYSGVRVSGAPVTTAAKTALSTMAKVVGIGSISSILIGVVHYYLF